MTSAISATNNPFEVIARAQQPITSKAIKEAVDAAPEAIKDKVTEKRVYTDLKQIITTNAFGDKTPQLAEDAAARVAELEPRKKPSAFNNTAAAFDEVLAGAVGTRYPAAQALSALITGAVVALEASLTTKTPEQKADKEALIDAFKTKGLSVQTMQTFASMWAAYAEPADDGYFALEHDTAQALAESIKEGTINEKLKGILFKTLGPEALGGEKLPSAEEAAAASAAAERERTRPIGGKTQEQLEALYKDLAAKAQTARITYRPETFRPSKYQKILNAVNQSPLTQILVPMLKELIGRYNTATRRAQKADYTEISAKSAAKEKKNDKQLYAVYKVAQRVAERMGAGDPSVTRVAQDVLNAWVSSVDTDNPHITYFSHLQHIVWDGEKGDWLKFHVDANDQICEADAPGAKEVSGERLVEVVFAHELMHIFEGAVLNQYLLAVLLGVALDTDSAKLHGEGCLCNGCGSITEKSELAHKIAADPQVKAFLADSTHDGYRLELARELGVEKAVETITNHNALRASGATPTPQQDAAAKSAASGLGSFFQMFTRLGEYTADYGAMRLIGPDAPRWLSMTFDIVTRSTGKGGPGERLQALKESYQRDHRGNATEKLAYSEEGGRVSHALYALQTTHPTRILRPYANYRHADKPDTKAVWAFENQPASVRILGAAQAIESEIERIEERHADYQHGSPKDKAAEDPDEGLKVLDDAHSKMDVPEQTERMRIVTSEIAKLVFADGLDMSEGRVAYAIQVANFMKDQGESIFRQEHEASNPLAALLGGGGGPTPCCTRMAKQVAQELQKVVDAAKPGEPERTAWQKIIETYEKIASLGDGVQAARIARTQKMAAMRTMQGRV